MTNSYPPNVQEADDYYLDITAEVCPLTFVRTKLLIERMVPGETALVLLRGAEPLANVPRAIVGQGHELLGLQPFDSFGEDVHQLRFRKAGVTNPSA